MNEQELKRCIQNTYYLTESKHDIYRRIYNSFHDLVEKDLAMSETEAKEFIYDAIDEVDVED